METGAIVIHQQEPTPTQFTPQVVQYASPLAIRLVNKKTTTADWDFDLINEAGRSQTFHFTTGTSLAHSAAKTCSLRLLSAARAEVSAGVGNTAPAFVRLEYAVGGWTEIDCTTLQPVRIKSRSGRITDLTALPTATRTHIVTQAGVLRQIKAAQGLVDFVQVATQAFEIRFYESTQVGTFDGTSGLYPLSGSSYRVVRFANASTSTTDYGHVKITETWGTEVDESLFDYNATLKEWTLTEGDATAKRVEYKDSIPGPGTNETTIRHTLKDEENRVVSTTHEVKHEFPWGAQTVTYIQEPATLNLASAYTYYETSGLPGYKKIKSRQEPDGDWASYTYDANDRVTETVRPWKDSTLQYPLVGPRQIITRSYASLDTADVVGALDSKPRTVTTSVVTESGATPIVTGRTWHVYKTDAQGVYTEIEERAASASAAFGATGNLRTTRVFYTTFDTQSGYDAASAGYLRYEDRPDGIRAAYVYTRNTSAPDAYFTTSERWVTPAQPDGVDGLSTRTDYIHNVKGYLVKIESYLRSGGAWHLYATEDRSYNGQGFQVLTTFNGRQTYAASYRRTQSPASAETGRLFSETNEKGITTTYTYDALGKVESRTRKGVSASGAYAAQFDIVTTYLRELGGLNCGCDGEITEIVSAGGQSMESKSKKDGIGRLTYEKDAAGLETFYSNTLGGRQVTCTNPDSSTLVLLNYYDGRSKSITGTGTIAEYYDYGVNTDGSRWTQVSNISASGDRWKKITVNLLGQIIREERPAYDGGVLTTTYSYNNLGRLVRQRQRHFSGATESTLCADTLFEYDALGNVSRTGLDVNANGTLDPASADRVTGTVIAFAEYESAWWRVVQTKVYPVLDSSTAVQVSEQRDRFSGLSGTLTSESAALDIEGNLTRQTIDVDFANKLSTATITYPDSTLPVVQVSRNGLFVSATSKTVASPTLYTYEPFGRLASIKQPRVSTASYFYYFSNSPQLGETVNTSGVATDYTYYTNGQVGAGRVKGTAKGSSITERFAYDLQGRPIQKWGTADYPQAYAYTAHGELQSLTTWRSVGSANLDGSAWPAPAGGDVTTWVYQAATGLLTRKEYADGKGTNYTYDKLNRLLTRTWARTVSLPAPGSALVTTYGYVSSTGELASIDYSDATPDVALTYDRLGRTATVADVTGTRTFAYDGAKLRLQTETLPSYFGDRIITRAYQTTGSGRIPGRPAGYQLGSAADPDQDFAVTYSYDTAGRLNGLVSPAGSYAYGYVANSDLVATLTSPVHVAATAYESGRDVIDYVENKVGSTTISKYDYTVNGLGQRTARAQSGTAFAQASTDVYSYNFRSEVTGATNAVLPARNQGFGYDNIGNWLTFTAAVGTTSYTANNLNQYSSIQVSGASAQTPSYDFDGNQTSTGLGQAYVWDAENRLVSVEPVIPAGGDKKVISAYDAFSRRVRRQVFTYASGAWGLTTDEKFIYEGWNVVEILRWDPSASAFSVSKAFTWGLDLSVSLQDAGGAGGLLAVQDGGAIYHYTYDANGNVSELLDGFGGVAAHYEYAPFGDSIVSSGAYAATNEYRFCTKFMDAASFLYYYGYRYYNPIVGCWLGRDPIEERGGVTLYAYVENDPVNWFDLWGLSPGISILSPGSPAYLAEFLPDVAASGLSTAAAIEAAKKAEEAAKKAEEEKKKNDGVVDCPGKPPFKGVPGSTVRGPGQTRQYGDDGYPKTDRDAGHPDEKAPGNGDHVHDWDRPAGGGMPTAKDRRPPRSPKPNDPPPPSGYPSKS